MISLPRINRKELKYAGRKRPTGHRAVDEGGSGRVDEEMWREMETEERLGWVGVMEEGGWGKMRRMGEV